MATDINFKIEYVGDDGQSQRATRTTRDDAAKEAARAAREEERERRQEMRDRLRNMRRAGRRRKAAEQAEQREQRSQEQMQKRVERARKEQERADKRAQKEQEKAREQARREAEREEASAARERKKYEDYIQRMEMESYYDEMRAITQRRRFINDLLGAFNNAHLGRRINHFIDFLNAITGNIPQRPEADAFRETLRGRTDQIFGRERRAPNRGQTVDAEVVRPGRQQQGGMASFLRNMLSEGFARMFGDALSRTVQGAFSKVTQMLTGAFKGIFGRLGGLFRGLFDRGRGAARRAYDRFTGAGRRYTGQRQPLRIAGPPSTNRTTGRSVPTELIIPNRGLIPAGSGGGGGLIPRAGGLIAGAGRAGGLIAGGGAAIGALFNPVTAGIAAAVAVLVAGLAALAAGALAADMSLRRFSSTLDDMPGPLMFANIREELRDFQFNLRRANRFGPGLARAREARGRINRATTTMFDNLTETFLPLLEAFANIIEPLIEIGTLALEFLTPLIWIKPMFEILRVVSQVFVAGYEFIKETIFAILESGWIPLGKTIAKFIKTKLNELPKDEEILGMNQVWAWMNRAAGKAGFNHPNSIPNVKARGGQAVPNWDGW